VALIGEPIREVTFEPLEGPLAAPLPAEPELEPERELETVDA
jgi:hypothetical protein